MSTGGVTGVCSVWSTCWGGREGPGVGFILVLQFLASWPIFRHLKHLSSLMHFMCSWGKSFLSLTESTSMAFASEGVRGEGVLGVLKLEYHTPLLSSLMCNFWLWKTFAFTIHSSRVSGGFCMDRIMVEICRSSPMENWVTAVRHLHGYGLALWVVSVGTCGYGYGYGCPYPWLYPYPHHGFCITSKGMKALIYIIPISGLYVILTWLGDYLFVTSQDKF